MILCIWELEKAKPILECHGAINTTAIETISSTISTISDILTTLATKDELQGYVETSNFSEVVDELQTQIDEKVTSGQVMSIVNEIVVDPSYEELNPLIDPLTDFVDGL